MARLASKVRKEMLIDAALKAARKHGYMHVMRKQIADEAGCSNSLVSAYWGTMKQVQRAIMRHAVSVGDPVVVAQGLANKDRLALKASDELRKAAAATLV